MSLSFPASAFDRGRAFLAAHGRPLERSRLAFSLGEARDADVLDALAPFQNSDGGFGNGIEPDLPVPESSAIATSVGCQVLRAIGAGHEHAMVAKAVDWLLRHLDRERRIWEIVPPSVEGQVHAPWWNYPKDAEESWRGYRYSPSAELLSYLFAWRPLVDGRLLAVLSADFAERLRRAPPSDIYDLYCCLRLYAAPGVPDEIRTSLGAAIVSAATKQDPASFHVNYFELVPSSQALLYPHLRRQFEASVQAAIKTQGGDGGWHPPWSWAEVNENAWRTAASAWSSVLTCNVLETVHRHGLVR